MVEFDTQQLYFLSSTRQLDEMMGRIRSHLTIAVTPAVSLNELKILCAREKSSPHKNAKQVVLCQCDEKKGHQNEMNFGDCLIRSAMAPIVSLKTVLFLLLYDHPM